MTDKDAEQAHGQVATQPLFDLHMQPVAGGLEVLLWLNGQRYYGTLTKETTE